MIFVSEKLLFSIQSGHATGKNSMSLAIMQKMTRRKVRENWKIILAGIMVIIIFILSVFLYSNIVDYISTYEKREVYAQIIVSNNFGIAINDSSMIFGMTVPGGTSRKDIRLENNYKKDVKFNIYSEGNITDFLIVSENNFILKPLEHKTLTFTVKVPKNASLGIYNGKIVFIVKNPLIK